MGFTMVNTKTKILMKVCIEKLSDESLYCFVCMVCILRVDIDVIYKTKYNKIYIDTN